jgi:hypothetical protein
MVAFFIQACRHRLGAIVASVPTRVSEEILGASQGMDDQRPAVWPGDNQPERRPGSGQCSRPSLERMSSSPHGTSDFWTGRLRSAPQKASNFRHRRYKTRTTKGTMTEAHCDRTGPARWLGARARKSAAGAGV